MISIGCGMCRDTGRASDRGGDDRKRGPAYAR